TAAASIPAPGNIPAANDLTDDSQSPVAPKADYLNSPLPSDGKLPAAVIMQGVQVESPGLIPPPGVISPDHSDDRPFLADPNTSEPPAPALTDTAPAPSQPDKSFLRAVRTKLPRVYIQPDARPSKLPAPGVLIGELVSPGGRVTKIQRCVLAQDGHSNG